MSNEDRPYGLVAEFATPEQLITAAREAREAGYRRLDAFSPFPVEGLADRHSALLPLLALPLVIHLLNRSFPRHFHFPTVELIRQTLAHRSRLNRWRHWILIALRTLLLLLLLIAFLRPVLPRFGGTPAQQAARRVLIVLDHSLSMEHTGDGATSRERAVNEATKKRPRRRLRARGRARSTSAKISGSSSQSPAALEAS